jgi:hypothetical protein
MVLIKRATASAKFGAMLFSTESNTRHPVLPVKIRAQLVTLARQCDTGRDPVPTLTFTIAAPTRSAFPCHVFGWLADQILR